MLLLIVGGIASGKSAYAEQWAATLGREAIRLSCPSYPDDNRLNRSSGISDASVFSWIEMPADERISATLHRINRESNVFRADRRVLVLDSLSGWLRGQARRARSAGREPADMNPDEPGSLRELVEALLLYEGKRIVVTEEAAIGLAEDPWERWYAAELAAAVRRLSEESHTLYRVTAGLAAEVKGYRVKRRNRIDEHIYPYRG